MMTGITYHEDDTAEISSKLQVTLGHLLTVRNDDGASLASCLFRQRSIRPSGENEARTESVDDVASKLASCAKYGSSMSFFHRSAMLRTR